MNIRVGYFYKHKETGWLMCLRYVTSETIVIYGVNTEYKLSITPEHFELMYTEYNP